MNQQEEIDQLKAHNTALLQCLIERDGGTHDVDCKFWQARQCNCGHLNAMQLIHKHPSGCLSEHDLKLLGDVAFNMAANGVVDAGHITVLSLMERTIKKSAQKQQPTPTDIGVQVVEEKEYKTVGPDQNGRFYKVEEKK